MELLSNFFSRHDIIRETLYTIIVLLSAWAIARIVDRILRGVRQEFSDRTQSRLGRHILEASRGPIVYGIFLLGAYIAFHRLGLTVAYYRYIDNIIFVVGVILGVSMATRVLAALLNWYQAKVTLHADAHLELEFLPLVDKLMRVLLLLIGIGIVLDRFRIDVRSILLTLGVGSLAIGLALQDTLANMFGGFTIMIDRPFRLSDHIRLTTGEEGDVVSIGMRSTRIKTGDNNMLIIPNSLLVKNILINHSYPDNSLAIRVKIGVEHGTDVNKAKEILRQAADTVSEILKDPPPVVYMTEFTEYGQTLLLLARIADHRQKDAALDQVNQRISDSLRAAAINIAVPSKRVYIANPSPPAQKG